MLELAKTMNVGQPKKYKSKRRKGRLNLFHYMFGEEEKAARAAGAVSRSRVGRVNGDGSDSGCEYVKDSDDSDDNVDDRGRRSTGRGGVRRSTRGVGGRRTPRRGAATGVGENIRRGAIFDNKDIRVNAGNDTRRRFDSTRAGKQSVGGRKKTHQDKGFFGYFVNVVEIMDPTRSFP